MGGSPQIKKKKIRIKGGSQTILNGPNSNLTTQAINNKKIIFLPKTGCRRQQFVKFSGE